MLSLEAVYKLCCTICGLPLGVNGKFYYFTPNSESELTDCYIALFYSPRSLKALHTTCLIHKHFFMLKCSLSNIHMCLYSDGCNLGLVSCPGIFGMQTGAVRDQTNRLLSVFFFPSFKFEFTGINKNKRLKRYCSVAKLT